MTMDLQEQRRLAALEEQVAYLIRNVEVPASPTFATLPGVPAALKSDPNADRIIFWDDSATALGFLGLGGYLSLTGTTLSASVPDATTSTKGIGETSTDAEAQAKSSGSVFLTPSNLAALAASETFAGFAERASSGEAAGLSDDVRFMTAAKTLAAMRAHQVPACRLTKSSAQSTHATANTDTAIAWNVETFDTGMHSTASNTSRVTATVPGRYLFNGRGRLNTTSATGQVQLAKNGSAISESSDYALGNATQAPYPNIVDVIELDAGDYVELWVRSNASSVGLIVGNCSLSAFWIGAA